MTSSAVDEKLEIDKKNLENKLEIYKNLEIKLEIYSYFQLENQNSKNSKFSSLKKL